MECETRAMRESSKNRFFLTRFHLRKSGTPRLPEAYRRAPEKREKSNACENSEKPFTTVYLFIVTDNMTGSENSDFSYCH